MVITNENITDLTQKSDHTVNLKVLNRRIITKIS
jgi:hypothetical protein